MNDRILIESPRQDRVSRVRRWVLLAVPLVSILFQVYVPLFVETFSYIELPLLVTVYLALSYRHPIGGMLLGAGVGLVQDSLSHQPLGMFGIVKTLVGYFAASVGLRFDIEHPLIRLLLAFFLFLFHQLFYWVLRRALLGQLVPFEIRLALLTGLLNAFVALVVFHILDKLKEKG